MSRKIRVVHIIYRLDVGGLENGLVNLLNRFLVDRFSHAIFCLSHATDFRQRIQREDVEIVEFHKPAGKHLPTYGRVFRELRRLRPDVVHTRNLGTLDMAWVAHLAGCAVRVHGEHGWSVEDPQGKSARYRLLRKACDPAVDKYVAVSEDIRRWLVNVVGVTDTKVSTIHNGVDLGRFTAPDRQEEHTPVVFGTVGRQEPIKGLEVFLAAVHDLLEENPERREGIRVIMAGDGPSHRDCIVLRDRYGLQETVELPGEVADVPRLMRQFSFFVQPSLNEGVSNTVLEAMASGLPVIATDVGGNPELVRHGREGRLIPANDSAALRKAIQRYLDDVVSRRRDGEAARARAEQRFSLETMVRNYEQFYSRAVVAAGLQIA